MARRRLEFQDIRETRRDLGANLTAQLLSRFRTGLPAINRVTGPLRRWRLHVPTPDEGGTSLGLGWKQDGLLYPGFGLQTVGHVVASARGGKTDSTMSLLANGALLVQSDDDGLYLVSKAPSVLASSRVANVLGSGGVVLAGGWPTDVANAPVAGLAPPVPPTAMAGFPAHMASIVAAATEWDGKASAAAAARLAVDRGAEPEKSSGWSEALGRAASLVTSACVGNDALGDAGASGGGGVVLHGLGGFALSTPAYGWVHATAGFLLASKAPLVVGLQDAELHAGQNAKVSSGKHASVLAQDSLVLAATDGVSVLASRKSAVLVRGKYVAVGTFTPEAPQEPTRRTHIRSAHHLSIATNPEREKKAAGIWIDSHDVLELKAKKQAKIESDEQVWLATDDSIFVVLQQEERRIVLKSDDAQLTLHRATGVTMQQQGGARVIAQRHVVAAGFGSVGRLRIRSNGAVNLESAYKIYIG